MNNVKVLELKHLTKVINKKTVVDDLSFSVNAGEIFKKLLVILSILP